MSRDFACATCRDRGFLAPRWQDDTDQSVPCPARGCLAAEELAERCEHPRRAPATRLPAGCFSCLDCRAVFRMRSAS